MIAAGVIGANGARRQMKKRADLDQVTLLNFFQ